MRDDFTFYMPPPPPQTDIRQHPGQVLKAVIDSGITSEDALVRAGIDSEWLKNFLRRQQDFAHERDPYAKVMEKLTGLPMSYWIDIQGEWLKRMHDEYEAMKGRGRHA